MTGPLLAIYLATALGAYLLGSIPSGFVVAKVKGIDIRKTGSGNIGATNAMRVLGKPAGIFVLLLDALKGYAAVVWLTPFVFNLVAPHFFKFDYNHPTGFFFEPFKGQDIELQLRLFVFAGIFAVMGHNYTCWLKFKGGKGIATSAGVYLALAPWAVLIAVAVFILAVAITKYVSVGSIAAAIALPAAVWVLQPQNYFLGIVTTALGALAIFKHRSNIQRVVAGTENRLGQKKSEDAK